MGAFVDLDDYLKRCLGPQQMIQGIKSSNTMVQGRPTTWWVNNPLPGVAPTTAAACSSATAGGFPFVNATSGELRVTNGVMTMGTPSLLVLCDRLSHQGGLNATVTGALTTNLPTAALTRYTDGAGVFLAIDIYTIIGTTATTVTCTYTDSVNGASRLSPTLVFGGTGYREAARRILLPLAAGDMNPVSVQDSTIAATTGTGGSFGYTLFKPLVAFACDILSDTRDINLIDGGLLGGFPEIVDDACLEWMAIPLQGTGNLPVGYFNLSAV